MPQTDSYDGQTNISSQGERWAAITPADGIVLAERPKALWANVAGDIRMAGEDGVFATFTVPAGTPIPLRPIVINLTLTTATGIIGIYG